MDRKLAKESRITGGYRDADSQTSFGLVQFNMISRSSIFTKRNKCFVASILGVVFIILLVMNSGLLSSGSPPGELCKLSDIDVQEDFDKEKFAGSWYGAYTKGMTNSLIGKLLEFYDVKIKFILRDDGNFDITSVGGKFLGVWCPVGEGHAEIASDDSPQKLEVFFDTPTGKKLGRKSVWVLKTDYTSYAVVYSCWDETPSGRCAAPYAIIVSKTTKKLPAKTMKEVHKVISGACMNPKDLKPVVHEGYCKKIRDSFE